MWVKAESTVRPEEIDKTSSAKYVLIRKDIQEVPAYDSEGKEEGTKFEYLENAVLKSDWDTYEAAMEAKQTGNDNSADIEYIAMMSDIDLRA